MSASITVYPPLDVLKPVAPDIWIVDSGPLHAIGLATPVRMTVVRLKSGDPARVRSFSPEIDYA